MVQATQATTKPRRLINFMQLALAFIGVLMLTLALPTKALARSYDIDPVNIDATVAPDGSMTVVEQRTFNFDGSFNGVYWDIPGGTYQGRTVEIEILSAERNVSGTWESLRQTDSASVGDDGVYAISESGSITRLQIFSPAEDRSVTFRISYRITGGVSAWQDTAELYWKFVSDGWDEPSNHVSCTIHLPKPTGTDIVAGENVRLWGHGSLLGEAQATEDGAVFTVPKVGTSEFAEARITFPVEWLSDVEPSGEARLKRIIAEETNWANEANAKREIARRKIGITGAAGAGSILAALATALFSWSRYKKSRKTSFDGEYFRDVPSEDHPAVLGTLYNGGDVQDKELTATLMNLSDQGAVGLDLVSSVKKGALGDKVVSDYRLTRNNVVADQLSDAIDRKADLFLFDFLAMRSAGMRGETYETGYPPLDFAQMQKVAEKYPSTYDSKYSEWQKEVREIVESRGFFKSDGPAPSRAFPIVIGVLAILASIAEIIIGFSLGSYAIALGVGIALFVMAVVLFIVAGMMKPYSQEANEIIAKMEGLKRWLKDFTRLKEAIPTDVVLWNKLLIMAVVLGVADQVIKQLRVVMPELLDDPALQRTYHWCSAHGDSRAPSKAFTSGVSAASSASAAELAASSDSSGGGGGGGFSGGGGGGFGGGGGGGAF